jgi:hypothetical protein
MELYVYMPSWRGQRKLYLSLLKAQAAESIYCLRYIQDKEGIGFECLAEGETSFFLKVPRQPIGFSYFYPTGTGTFPTGQSGFGVKMSTGLYLTFRRRLHGAIPAVHPTSLCHVT